MSTYNPYIAETLIDQVLCLFEYTVKVNERKEESTAASALKTF